MNSHMVPEPAALEPAPYVTVYHLLVDRFQRDDGDWSGDDMSSALQFRGGTLAGVTKRIREGWFSRLGITALLLSAPYEQVLGWLPDASGRFAHFPYHGYWPLDFTVIDRRLGCDADLHALVSAAHKGGMRVVLDVVLGHAGYLDLHTVARYFPRHVRPGWELATPPDYADYMAADRYDQLMWGRDWISEPSPQSQQHCLPVFALENANPVGLPPFLTQKADTKAVYKAGWTVRDYMVSWLTYWVREFGIDGFRCDSAKHVPLPAWRALKEAASAAAHSQEFWMTGEVFGHGIERDTYFDHGFDSLINFSFQTELMTMMARWVPGHAYSTELYHGRLDRLYQDYAAQLSGPNAHQVLSYISSHDTVLFDRARLADAATALMLLPGDVLLFYGDECARPPGPSCPLDAAQATRSVMNWEHDQDALLRHWQALGRFRARHPAVARGNHARLSTTPYAFQRTFREREDVVIVVLAYTGVLRLNVHGVFPEGVTLLDAYSRTLTTVIDGHVQLTVAGLALLEIHNYDEEKQ